MLAIIALYIEFRALIDPLLIAIGPPSGRDSPSKESFSLVVLAMGLAFGMTWYAMKTLRLILAALGLGIVLLLLLGTYVWAGFKHGLMPYGTGDFLLSLTFFAAISGLLGWSIKEVLMERQREKQRQAR